MTFDDKPKTVLIIDDEPFQTQWLTDYFRAKGLDVVQAEDLQSALKALEKTRYGYIIIDLSIPFSPALAQPLAALGSHFFRYPGLMAARRARTTGHNTYQVIVYSVHDSGDVESYSELIVCKYILKGRPRELKDHINDTLKYLPHGWHSPIKKAVKRKATGDARPVGKKKSVAKKKATAKAKSPAKRKSFYSRYAPLVVRRKSEGTKK